jgi:DNA-binding transcriptional ArsR family regulator
MADLQFIREEREPTFRFEVAPLHNALCSLCLLDQKHLDGISDWVDATVAAMTPEERERSGHACETVGFVSRTTAETVEEFVEALRATDSRTLFSHQLRHLVEKASMMLSGPQVPAPEELIKNETAFVGLIERMHEAKDEPFSKEEAHADYRRMSAPDYAARSAEVISELWNKYLRDEWSAVRLTVEESVAAFRSIEIPGNGVQEKLKFVTQRDYIPEQWIDAIQNTREIVFVPSVHIGPYMLLLDHDHERAIIVGRARIPEGATASSATLTRADLLIRLEALSDSVRLAILEMAAREDKITTQDVMDKLSLSQSSASRHLTQLAATGLLTVDASERTKRYSVHTRRIDDVCNGIQQLLGEPRNQE